MSEETTAEVEFEIGGVKTTIEMALKDRDELEDCEQGKIIIILTHDGQEWTGRLHEFELFEGVTIKPIDGGGGMHFEYDWFSEYLEEIK